MKKGLRALIVCCLAFVLMTVPVFASTDAGNVQKAGQSAGEAYRQLYQEILKGSYLCNKTGVTCGGAGKSYKVSGGGVVTWSELLSTDPSQVINEPAFETLTAKSKQEFVGDILSVANAMSTDTEAGLGTTHEVSDETVQDLMQVLQVKSGMGSTLLATLLVNTKPDYVTANRIYEPFSGIIGTILGLLSILIMALIGVTMALDIAYIVIPAFQILLDGDSDGSGQGGQGGKKGMSKIVSAAARNAVKAGDGANGQTGEGNKMALGVYFKYRWKELIVLGICLLYLVQGQIYNFVAWILDLVSGFLGF